MDRNIRLQLEGMHCLSCEKIIEMELMDVPGVKSAKISFDGRNGEVIAEERVEESRILEAVSKAGYQGRIIDDSGHQVPEEEIPEIVMEKKIVGSEAPFKIRLESSAVADGEFSQTDKGPVLKGSVNHTKRGEFEIPQGRNDIEAVIRDLFTSSKLGQIFSLFSDGSKENSSPASGRKELPGNNIIEPQADGQEKIKSH